jgi:hypothetical protein
MTFSHSTQPDKSRNVPNIDELVTEIYFPLYIITGYFIVIFAFVSQSYKVKSVRINITRSGILTNAVSLAQPHISTYLFVNHVSFNVTLLFWTTGMFIHYVMNALVIFITFWFQEFLVVLRYCQDLWHICQELREEKVKFWTVSKFKHGTWKILSFRNGKLKAKKYFFLQIQTCIFNEIREFVCLFLRFYLFICIKGILPCFILLFSFTTPKIGTWMWINNDLQ